MRLSTVILAAGLGTRMKSSIPKILHKLNGKPMIAHVVEAVKQLKPEKNIVVTGKNSETVKNVLSGCPVVFAVQKKPEGTGDALKTAVGKLRGFNGTVLVLGGDTPLITPETLQKFLKLHRKGRSDISIISFIAPKKHSYGRVIRDGRKVRSIIEDRDASEEQKEIREVNSGIYAIESHALKLLRDIRINPAKGEYYLTDIIGIAANKGCRVDAHEFGNETEFAGINTREELSLAGRYQRDRIVLKWMDKGVSFIDGSSVFIHPEVKIGNDTVIYPNVYLEGKTVIGSRCTIYPNARIIDSVIGNGSEIKDSTLVESSTVEARASVGPFAHIRPGTLIGSSSKIGNFVEIKKAIIGSGTKASHLSYIGDSEIGRNVNIGAGTITCNYDGKNKHKTVIEDNVFIGSDTQLVAPVKIGRGAYVGAGSTITKDVPPLSLALTRTKQTHIDKWALRRQLKVKSEKPQVKNKK